MSELNQQAILTRVCALLADMVQDWDLETEEAIGPATDIIADLEFESIDLIQLMVAVEKEFGVKGLPYEALVIADGAYIEELRVKTLVDFLAQHIL